MTNQQLQTIVGLMAAFQTSVVALTQALEKQGAIPDMQKLIAELEQHADGTPADLPNRDMLIFALKHLVIGLRDPGHDPSEDIARQLH